MEEKEWLDGRADSNTLERGVCIMPDDTTTMEGWKEADMCELASWIKEREELSDEDERWLMIGTMLEDELGRAEDSQNEDT
jgi:hypothetical protein